MVTALGSYTRLKAHDHCNLRALIGRKGQDRPSWLHTRRWRLKGPNKTARMKNVHGGVLHGGLWIRFYGLPKFSSGLSPRGGPTQVSGDHVFVLKYFFSNTYFMTGSITNSMTNKYHQVVMSHWWILRHIILNQTIPSISANKICNGVQA